jgi:regulator of protease activity HflC (stomatin/prohibitin superfamily)
MRQFAPNLLVFLLLLFLVSIYLLQPRTDVLTLGLLLLAVAVFLAYTNRPRGLEILAGMTAFVSILGMLVLGQAAGGTNGGYCFLVLWFVILALAVQAVRRRAVLVERGQVLVVNQLPTNRVMVLEEGLHRPLNPLFERKLAALPSYGLVLDTTLDQINTRAFSNVEHLRVTVRYTIEQPNEMVLHFPNREQAQTELVRERGEPPANNTTEQVAFWTELIQRQMTSETDRAVRSVLAGVSDLGKVVRSRHELEYGITERLQQSVTRWGIAVQDVRILEAVLDPQAQNKLERDAAARTGETIRQAAWTPPPAEQEATPPTEPSRPMASFDAPTQANTPAEQTDAVVQQVVERLQAQGKTVDPDEIKRTVRDILGERGAETRRRSNDEPPYGLSN